MFQSCNKIVLSMFQSCNKIVLSVFQSCNKIVLPVFQSFNKIVLSMFQSCNKIVLPVFQSCNKIVLSVFQSCNKIVLPVFQSFNKIVLSMFQSCNKIVLSVFQSCNKIVLPVFQSCNKIVLPVFQSFNKIVLSMFQSCNKIVLSVFQSCNKIVLPVFQSCNKIVLSVFQSCNKIVLPVFQSCNKIVFLSMFQSCNKIVLPVFQSCNKIVPPMFQTQDEQQRQQEFAASLISRLHSDECGNSTWPTESVVNEEGASGDNAHDSSLDWTTEEPPQKRAKLEAASPVKQSCQASPQVKTEAVIASDSNGFNNVEVVKEVDEQEGTIQEGAKQEGECIVIKQESVDNEVLEETIQSLHVDHKHLDICNLSNGVGDTSQPTKDDAETADIQHDNVGGTGRGNSYPYRRCPLCDRLFETRSKLLTHLASATCILSWGEDKQIPEDLAREIKAMEEVQGTACPRCGKTFQYKRNAKTHYALNLCGRKPVKRNPEKLVKDPTTNMYHCRHCDFTAHSPRKIIEHEARSHLEKKYACSVCERRYGSEYLLNQHMKLTHLSEKTIGICHVCGNSMKSKYLKRHIQICHDPNYVARERRTAGKEVNCPKCAYVGQNMRGLRRHHARRHEEKTFQCGECNTRFALHVDLSRHVLVMHSDACPARATVECPHCQKSMLKKNLDVHIHNVHDKIKAHVCCICSRAFQTKYTLRCHLETHKKRSERTYKFLCAECGGSFNNKTVYKDHVNMHTGNRPYHCNICNKAFKQISTYSRHMTLHRSCGRFQCKVCGESFTRQRLLDAHTSGQHGDRLVCLCGLQLDSMQEVNAHKATCSVWLGQEPQTTTEMENLLALAQEQSQVVLDSTGAATVVTADGETLFLFHDDKLTEENEQGTLFLVNKPTSDDIMDLDGTIVDEHDAATVAKQEGGEDDPDANTEEQSFLCGYCQQLFVGLDLVQNHMLTAHINELPQDTGQIQLALHPSQDDEQQRVDGLLLSGTDQLVGEAYDGDTSQLVLSDTATKDVLEQEDAELVGDSQETLQLETQEYDTL